MTEKIQIELTCNRQSFSFELCHRELDFGDAGRGEYFWMDGRSLRSSDRDNNLRNCIDFWWSRVEEAGEVDCRYNINNLVLAEAYPLVNKSRAMQKVFLDAHLKKDADRKVEDEDDVQGNSMRKIQRTYQLPEKERLRLTELVNGHDVRVIQNELKKLFLGEQPPNRERPAFTMASEAWIGNGAVAFRKGGRQGLRDYIQGDLNNIISQYRKGGIKEPVRLFLNMFSYECKASFYRCYANAWVFLLTKLEQEQGFNENTARFMRLWHHQNQPQEVRGGKVINFFYGQVLSLHPLSAIIMTDPGSLAVIGKWIGHSNYQQLSDENKVDTSQEYWDVILIILIAAHEYQQSHERCKNSRGQAETAQSAIVEQAEARKADLSIEEFLESYASKHAIFCEDCSGTLSYDSHKSVEPGNPSVVTYCCSQCQHRQTCDISEEAIREILYGDGEENSDN